MTTAIADIANLRLDCAYIDGDWVPASGSEKLPVVNPATSQIIAEVIAGTSADVDRAVAAARKAFPAFAATPVEERLALLERIHALILERAIRCLRQLNVRRAPVPGLGRLQGAGRGLAG